MNEIKQPKKQLITYIIMVAVVMVLLNSLIMPSLKDHGNGLQHIHNHDRE